MSQEMQQPTTEVQGVREEPVGIFDSDFDDLFTTYEAEITFRDRLMGGIPKNPKIVQGWLRSKAGITEARELYQVTKRTLAEASGIELPDISDEAMQGKTADELYDLIDAAAEEHAGITTTVGFKFDQNGLYIEDRQVKALIREGINVLYAGERWGKTNKGPKGFTAERVFIKPPRIYLGTKAPTGVETVIGHVTDKQGPRSTLGMHEYVDNAVISFRVSALRDQISPQHWKEFWLWAQENGLGALRSQSYGRFALTRWEKM